MNEAFHRAREKRHEFITIEHLLLSLLDIPDVIKILKNCDGDIGLLKKQLRDFIDQSTPTLEKEKNIEMQTTLGFQRVLQRAVFHVQSAGKKEVMSDNVLVAIFSEKKSQAIYFLAKQNITRLDVINYISHGEDNTQKNEFNTEDVSIENESNSDALIKFTANLNQLAKEGKIDPLVGRHKEIERVIQVLSRRRKNNPLLVGDAGVGKTAIAEGLAQLIVSNKVPRIIKDKIIFSLDMG
ncbi:MAG TPA: Clp protease N-terminal domain-containing protein, partial [Woeseiaceae bacterium]|nr:Clp protease N-terminal domain-containing protein [Woeseiaceae bacterium]